MSQAPVHNRRTKTIVLQIAQKVREKGKLSLGDIFLMTGYSPVYLKYYIIPLVEELFDDIRVVRENNTIYLVSESESGK